VSVTDYNAGWIAGYEEGVRTARNIVYRATQKLDAEIDVALNNLHAADPTRYATPDRPASTDAGAGNLP
jgi:hypothetical protein